MASDKKRVVDLSAIPIGVAWTVVLTAVLVTVWIMSHFWGLESRLSDKLSGLSDKLSDKIGEAERTVTRDLSTLSQRVTKVETQLGIQSPLAQTQDTDLERRVALYEFHDTIAKILPSSLRMRLVVGTVKGIDAQHRTITVRDPHGDESRLAIKDDAVTEAYTVRGIEQVPLRDLTQDRPIALIYDAADEERKVARLIGTAPSFQEEEASRGESAGSEQ